LITRSVDAYDESLEEHITGMASELDDLVAEAFLPVYPAPTTCGPDTPEREQHNRKVKTTSFKLWTTTDLTEDMMEEFSALVGMPQMPGRDERIKAFKDDLKASGIEAVFKTGKGAFTTHKGQGPHIMSKGKRIKANQASIYFIHFNHDFQEGAQIAYTAREVRRKLASDVIQGRDEDLTEQDIDEGTDAFYASVDNAYDDGVWKGLSVNTLDPVTHILKPFY
jgi:hypothetical protein